MDLIFILLAVIVLLAYTTQTLAGFGSIIISVTLGAHLYPIEFLLPVLVPLDVLLNTYIISKHHAHIDKRLLFKSILPLMGLGLLVGIFVFNYIEGVLLKRVFGIVVIGISTLQLIAIRRNAEANNTRHPFRNGLLILSGGILQGIYASGGPLLVYVAGRLNLTKEVFRSTLCALWIILNIILIISYAMTDRISPETFKFNALLLPVVIAGLLIGERLHSRINEKQFKTFVYVMLAVAGCSIATG